MGDILFVKAPQLIGKILSFHEVSHKSLDLWLTGSKIVQRALRLHVKKVTLHCEHNRTRSRLPNYLRHLHAIHELVVDRGDLYFTLAVQAQWTMFHVAPRLTKLVFRAGGGL